MVWASHNFLSERIRFDVPSLPSLQGTVRRRPELFYTGTPSSTPKARFSEKPKLKFIETISLALRLVWYDYRDRFLALIPIMQGNLKIHLRNIVLICDRW